MSIINPGKEGSFLKTPAQGSDAKKGVSSIGLSITLGLRLAIIGSATIALIECLVVTVLTAKHFSGDSWPIYLILAGLGKMTLTHTIIWCPLIAACAVIHWLWVGKRNSSVPVPFLSLMFITLIALIVIPANMELAFERSRTAIYAASVVSLVAAAGSYFALRAVIQKIGVLRAIKFINVASALSALMIIVPSIVFVQSPFFNPGAYRVPQASLLKGNAELPHVLFIVLDTVRADRMSCYGYGTPTTPFLKNWALSSIVFEKAIANGIPTPPSHASMFTGLSARSHGVIQGNQRLDDTFKTIAEVLSNHGYVTASFSNNPWISPDTNLTKGFSLAMVTWYIRQLSRFSLEYILEKWGITPIFPWLDPDYGAAMTNYMIYQWLNTYSIERKPIFLFVNYMEAHLPYRVPSKYRRMFMTDDQLNRSYDLRFNIYGDIVNTLEYRFNFQGGDFIKQPDREVLKRQYEAGIRYLDDRVHELIRMFEQRGLLQNTLIIITSDHGEYLDNHGMWAHRLLTYNDLTHVPLIVFSPDNHQPRRVSSPVQLSDIYPTVLKAALGIEEKNSAYESRDLLTPAVRDGHPRIVISESGVYSLKICKQIRKKWNDPRRSHLIEPQITSQDDRFKYIVANDGMRELYDLSVDPGEQNNLIKSHPAEAERLAAYIEEWFAVVPQYKASHSDTIIKDPNLKKALRTLGYVGGH